MTSERESDASRKSFGYLLLGYFLILVGILLSVDLGFESPGGPGPIAAGFGLSVSSLGFIFVVFSHVRYLRGRGGLSILDVDVLGIPIKYVVITVAIVVLTLGNVAFVLTNFYDIKTVEEFNLVLTVVGIIFLTIPGMVTFGVLAFNLLFVLAGPVYILLFYFTVVKGSDASS